MNNPNSQVTEQAREMVKEAAGCISAAYVEGWLEALAEGNIERIRDLWERRISFALPALEAALTARTEPNTIHSCSYYCDRPDCAKAQRDELREAYVARQSDRVVLVPMEPTAHMIESATGGSDFRTADCETLGDERALLRRQWAAMLSARPQPAQGDGWLPIESAPLDGTRFLGYAADYGICEIWAAEIDEDNGLISWGCAKWPSHGCGCCSCDSEPTHWRPLPPPPAPADGGGK